MKLFRYIALICVTAILASCEDSETFYTCSYPVVRVESMTTVKSEESKPEPEPEPDPKPTPDPEPAPAAVATEEPSGPSEEEKLIEAVNSDVLASAPVQAGGNYTLDFTRHDGGTLTVDTATDAGQFISTFDKIPGKGELKIRFGEQEYTARIDSYTDEEGRRKVLLTVDLTKHYQALHPDDKITSVVRKEYTSAPYK